MTFQVLHDLFQSLKREGEGTREERGWEVKGKDRARQLAIRVLSDN